MAVDMTPKPDGLAHAAFDASRTQEAWRSGTSNGRISEPRTVDSEVAAAVEQHRFNWMIGQGRVTEALIPEGTQAAVILVDFRGGITTRTMEAGAPVSIKKYIPDGDHSEDTMVTPLWKPNTPDWARDGTYLNNRAPVVEAKA